MASNVYDIGTKQRIEVVNPACFDSRLTAEAEAIRDIFSFDHDSHSVFVGEQLDGYLPQVLANGDMRVAPQAREDFRQTFSALEIPTDSLLVVYTAVRHGIEEKRKTDTHFHEWLGAAAIKATLHTAIHNKTTDRHVAEDLLIGWVASFTAAKHASNTQLTKAGRERMPARVMAAADARNVKHDISEFKSERKQVMGHFATLPVPITKLANELLSAAHNL